MLRHTLLIIAITASAGCLRSTTFQCENSAQCGSEGVCEPDRYCSFPSSDCASMRAYGDNSGPNSGECVGGGSGSEAGMEMPLPGSEPVPMGCPGDFAALAAGSEGNHRYKAFPAATWAAHRTTCSNLGTFIAYPEGATQAAAQAELDGLRALSGDGTWLGINDITVEGAYVRTLDNMPVSANTAALFNIGGNQGEKNSQDCLIIDNTTIDDALCGDSRKAVCECVP